MTTINKSNQIIFTIFISTLIAMNIIFKKLIDSNDMKQLNNYRKIYENNLVLDFNKAKNIS